MIDLKKVIVAAACKKREIKKIQNKRKWAGQQQHAPENIQRLFQRVSISEYQINSLII